MKPLLSEHGKERRKQGGREARVKESRNGYVSRRWSRPRRCYFFTLKLIEDRFEVLHWLWFQLLLSIDNECRTHSGKQTGLTMGLLNSTYIHLRWGTHEDQARIEVRIALLDKLFVVLGGFPLIRGVEIRSWVACPCWFEEEAQSLLYAGLLCEVRRTGDGLGSSPA